MPVSSDYRPSRSHAALGDAFYDPVPPAAFPQHILRWRNQRAAETVGLGGLTDAEWIDHFGRFQPLPGSFETPLALRYHGHQFRHYNQTPGFVLEQLWSHALASWQAFYTLQTREPGLPK